MEFAVNKGNKTHGLLLGGGLGNEILDYCGSQKIGANVERGQEVMVTISEVIVIVDKEEGRKGRWTFWRYGHTHSSSHDDGVGGCATLWPIKLLRWF